MHQNDHKEMRKYIVNGLQETIKTHGPITKTLVGSAAKRIFGKIKSYYRNRINAETTNRIP